MAGPGYPLTDLERQEEGWENYKDPFNRKVNHALKGLFSKKKPKVTRQQGESIRQNLLDYYNQVTVNPLDAWGYTEDQKRQNDAMLQEYGLPVMDHRKVEEEYSSQVNEVVANVEKQLAEEGLARYATYPQGDYRREQYVKRYEELRKAALDELHKKRKEKYQGAGELEE